MNLRTVASLITLWASLAPWTAPSAFAQVQDTPSHPALGTLFAAVQEVDDEQTRLLIYRPNDEGGGVITLHMDGRYHTSLQPGAYSTLCLNAGSINLQAQPGRSWARADPEREVSQSVVMTGGQTLYVRLIETQLSRPKIEVVPVQVAAQEIIHTRRQIHSISRVKAAIPCVDKISPSLAIAPDVVVLSAQSAQDPNAIDALIQRLSTQYKDMRRVALSIVAHVEDAGSEAANQSLSTSLAQNIQQQFARRTNPFNPITSTGRGSQDSSPATVQLRRRVEIGITVLEY